MTEVTGNRKYKDRLFRSIFREKEDLLSLYNAINDSNYQDPEQLEITTIEDILYMGMKNDISFLIDDYLNLYEAQSTWKSTLRFGPHKANVPRTFCAQTCLCGDYSISPGFMQAMWSPTVWIFIPVPS